MVENKWSLFAFFLLVTYQRWNAVVVDSHTPEYVLPRGDRNNGGRVVESNNVCMLCNVIFYTLKRSVVS